MTHPGLPGMSSERKKAMQYPTAVRSAEIEIHLFEDDGTIPNNPKLPLILYRSALDFGAPEPQPVNLLALIALEPEMKPGERRDRARGADEVHRMGGDHLL
jgi:hypothetical protein